MEVSSYIHPPFKITTSWSNRLGVKDVVEFRTLDVFQSSGVFVIELCCKFWCRDFGSGLLGVVFTAISFPLDKILESFLVPTTVEYFLHLLLCFSVDDYGWWVVFHFVSCNRVIRSRS